jgi:hypothetical protein
MELLARGIVTVCIYSIRYIPCSRFVRVRQMPVRRFPAPWMIEDRRDACFVVKDSNGQALAYVYFESEQGRRTAANLLTRDEARRIAANIAKLPEFGVLTAS